MSDISESHNSEKATAIISLNSLMKKQDKMLNLTGRKIVARMSLNFLLKKRTQEALLYLRVTYPLNFTELLTEKIKNKSG